MTPYVVFPVLVIMWIAALKLKKLTGINGSPEPSCHKVPAPHSGAKCSSDTTVVRIK